MRDISQGPILEKQIRAMAAEENHRTSSPDRLFNPKWSALNTHIHISYINSAGHIYVCLYLSIILKERISLREIPEKLERVEWEYYIYSTHILKKLKEHLLVFLKLL